MYIPDRDQNGRLVTRLEPFTTNSLIDGSVLYTKIHGVKASFAIGETKTLEITIPYTTIFLAEAEIVIGVMATNNFHVVHPGTGASLEQYGFNLNVGEIQYKHKSPYVAQIPQGLKLTCEVTNVSGLAKEIGVNFVLHEARTA